MLSMAGDESLAATGLKPNQRGRKMKSVLHVPGRMLAICLLGVSTIVSAQPINVPTLSADVTVYTDADGIPTIAGETERDVTFVQGYLHAQDRFFQMDFLRRVASGTLGEILGAPALENDIQLRTLGLRRAAFATWTRLSPEEKGWMKAYADGVNTWLRNNDLPLEYQALELTAAEPWTPVDSLAIGKLLSFQLSFDSADPDLTVDFLTYQGVGDFAGFDGAALFLEDIFRVAPEDDRVSIPTWFEDAGIIQVPAAATVKSNAGKRSGSNVPFRALDGSAELVESLRRYVDQLRQLPVIGDSIAGDIESAGSNWFIISGEHTESGYPILAHDPHLGLDMAPIFTKENLVIRNEGVAVAGVSFPGTPLVVLGCNLSICWGATVNPHDVTDYYQEQFLVNNFGLPTHTLHNGQPEPLKVVFQSYFVNSVGDGEPDNVERANVPFDGGGITFIVPRRNNGPIVAQPSATEGVSVQYTGWGPTFELSTFRAWARAENLDEFQAALADFTVGGQNFGYADIDGNIAYFTSGTVPLRADLQQGTVAGGVPPFLLRDGTGQLNHEWLPVDGQPVTRGINFAALPLTEMPQTVNPAQGYIANGNNDSVGTTLDNNALNQLRPGGNGIYYLSPRYVSLRMGRIDREIQDMIASGDKITVDDMKRLQANNQPLDAEIVTPYVLQAFENAIAEGAWPGIAQFAADPRIQEAVGRLAGWDFSTPTGIAEGFDPGENPVALSPPTEAEIANSVAATIYAVFRSQAIQNTIDATLSAIGLADNLPSGREANRAFMHLLQSFETNQGVGASGIPFFNVPEIEGLSPPTSPADQRDFVLLASLQGALDLLASDEFAPAFANSTDQNDYRWGRLHRIVFAHPLGVKPFNVPRGFGLNDLAEDLPGVARSGGFDVVDASGHDPRADGVNEFMFSAGPARRTVAHMTPARPVVDEIIPGGRSGVFLSPFYTNQLFFWLVNAYLPLDIGEADGQDGAVDVTTFTSQ